jgi:predicted transcriptional regulator
MKYRARYEIFATILEVASSGKEDATRTKRKEYLALLVENDLTEEFYKGGRYGKHEKAFYKPTDRGKRFLFLYNEINNSFSLELTQK